MSFASLVARYTRAPILWSMVAAAILVSTGLGVGFVADDLYHLMILSGARTPAPDGSMFTFAVGDPAVTNEYIRSGPYPWWTLPEVKVVFLRPLSTALHRIDFALFGTNGVPWHVHAMLWYLAMVGLWGLIARKILSAPIAALAPLLFAVDDAHWMPAVWLANRNALVACVPVLFALYSHIRWREEGWRPGLPLSVLGYFIGMWGGEAWLGVSAFVAAYEIAGRNDTLARRAVSLAPAAICAIAYAVFYKSMGYGVYGSGVYVEPLTRAYFVEAPNRILSLLGGLLLASPVEIWGFSPESRWPLAAVGCLGVALFVVLLRRAWPSLEERDRRSLRWLMLGGFLSLLPVIAAFPMNRLLLTPSLASSAVIAVLLRHWWQHRKIGKVPLGFAYATLGVIHLVIAPVAWPIQSGVVTLIGRVGHQVYESAPITDAESVNQDVILLAANDPMTLMYPPIARYMNGHPLPGSWNPLSASPHDHVFTRTGTKTFELETEKGALMHSVFADILRGPEFPFAAGDQVRLRSGTLTVLDAVDGKPRKIGLAYDVPLEDESLVFLVWLDFRLQRFELPRVGESVVVRYLSR